jgi:hypothetical protein
MALSEQALSDMRTSGERAVAAEAERKRLECRIADLQEEVPTHRPHRLAGSRACRR